MLIPTLNPLFGGLLLMMCQLGSESCSHLFLHCPPASNISGLTCLVFLMNIWFVHGEKKIVPIKGKI